MPLYAQFSGLPPLFIQASDTELLLDDAVRIAEIARLAQVSVNFKVLPRLPQAWPTMTPFLVEAKAAVKEAVNFIRSVRLCGCVVTQSLEHAAASTSIVS
ncbi:hypothetical protein GV819_25530 [Pseudomonas sp. Fl5BN2]|nr:hypothetical protein [Pseudomonas sp. Fl5BN2]